ncbi:MAG TPA: TetR/AcrR family transcriptional regulator [Erysipelothrix sp.]|nr:TetR/AcrR family transcriptional regulator [Erysipelothrix sp.]
MNYQPSGKQEDRRRIKTRQQIMQAFEQLIMEEGYDQMNVLKLTSKAKINRSTFYDHYADLDELYHSIIDDLMAHFTSFLVPEVFSEEGVVNLEKLHEIIVNILEEVATRRHFLINLIQTSDVRLLKDRIVLTIVSRYHDHIDLFSSQSPSKHDWELVVFYLSSVLYGFLNYWINATDPIDSDEMASSMIDLVLNGYS